MSFLIKDNIRKHFGYGIYGMLIINKAHLNLSKFITIDYSSISEIIKKLKINYHNRVRPNNQQTFHLV